VSTRPIRIQLVDDHEIVRAGFRQLLEKEGGVQVVAESESGKQACCDYKQFKPDIMILDISLPDISGLEAMHRVLGDDPRARIIMLSMHAGMVAERALQMGARGFVCKRSGARSLVTAIHQVMRGGRFLDEMAGVEMPKKTVAAAALSRREIEVCLLLSEGKSVAEIAGLLHVSAKTVYTHRQHIMDKLGVKTSAELVQAVRRTGILSGS